MTQLVGILNMTPDSFSDGGLSETTEQAIAHATTLFEEGASIVDVGAESTRPGAKPLDWCEELARLHGFIEHAENMGWRISVDTYHPETVAWVGQNLSEFIINDVTGFRDPAMRDLAAQLAAQVIVSHLPEASPDIQSAHETKPVDSVDQVIEELQLSVERLVDAGVARHLIIVDPGIGFGKTMDVNWELLRFGRHMPDHEVMVGYSRKRFLGEHRLEPEPNLRAGKIAVDANAEYLRVHDVKGHLPLVR